MIITIDDSTNSAKILYYQSLVLLYLPCEKFGADDNKNALTIKAWQDDGYNFVDIILKVGNKVEQLCDRNIINNKQYADMKNFIGRTFVKCAKRIFGFIPPWGISTGVKPVKLARMFLNSFGSNEAYRILTEEYLISPAKAQMSLNACIREDRLMSEIDDNPCSLYVSIPFCPTKCNYCSFVSCTTPRLLSLIPNYVVKLKNELNIISNVINDKKLKLQSVYIGGGTPAILDELQIYDLLSHINKHFDVNNCEFTFEAGRPDCITEEKLNILKSCGVDRISINTQTTNDNILKSVGRSHSYSQFVSCVESAKKVGFKCINTDLIAGLPDESFASFENSVKNIASLNVENITVHAFTLKKSSQYRIDGSLKLDNYNDAAKMTEFAATFLSSKGYSPYYVYRQKNTIGNLDNAGYSKDGYESIYNIIMMGEYHTVFGAGAGSVTKIVSPDKSKVERIFSPKYPYEFLDENKYTGFDAETCISLIEKGDNFGKE